MLYTPAALELALRWPFVSVLGGEDDRPETAESTLVKFAVSADMVDDSSYQILGQIKAGFAMGSGAWE